MHGFIMVRTDQDQIADDEMHCEKYRSFTLFPGVEILRKDTVSAEFRAKFPHSEMRWNYSILCSDKKRR